MFGAKNYTFVPSQRKLRAVSLSGLDDFPEGALAEVPHAFEVLMSGAPAISAARYSREQALQSLGCESESKR